MDKFLRVPETEHVSFSSSAATNALLCPAPAAHLLSSPSVPARLCSYSPFSWRVACAAVVATLSGQAPRSCGHRPSHAQQNRSYGRPQHDDGGMRVIMRPKSVLPAVLAASFGFTFAEQRMNTYMHNDVQRATHITTSQPPSFNQLYTFGILDTGCCH